MKDKLYCALVCVQVNVKYGSNICKLKERRAFIIDIATVWNNIPNVVIDIWNTLLAWINQTVGTLRKVGFLTW